MSHLVALSGESGLIPFERDNLLFLELNSAYRMASVLRIGPEINTAQHECGLALTERQHVNRCKLALTVKAIEGVVPEDRLKYCQDGSKDWLAQARVF